MAVAVAGVSFAACGGSSSLSYKDGFAEMNQWFGGPHTGIAGTNAQSRCTNEIVDNIPAYGVPPGNDQSELMQGCEAAANAAIQQFIHPGS